MLRIGQFIDNRYEILEHIGSGGMADVYKAKCHKLNRIVAIKMLKEEYVGNAELASRFQIEAQAAACLSHNNNIVGIYDVGEEGPYHYIVMEYIEGTTLKEIIERNGALEERDAVGIAIQIAQGLSAAHQQGIVHRDIKPQNILISNDGKVKVADFGIARVAGGDTIELMPSGSVHYIAPEQARGSHCDERSDIYSLGVTMYEMATGHVPFDGENAVAIAVAHMNDQAAEPRELNSSISPAFNSIILKCMSKKPERRYPTALALILDLKKAIVSPDAAVAVAPAGGDVTGKTIIMGADMIEQIKNEKNQPEEGDSPKTEPADSEETTDQAENEGNPEEEAEEEEATVMDRVILGFGIAFGILILAAVIYVVGSLAGFWPGNSETLPSKTAQGTSDQEDSESFTGNTEGLAEDETLMPYVVGMELTEAIQLLNSPYSLGYDIPEDCITYSDEYEAGTVCGQEYEEGTVLKKHTRVKLTISLGNGKFEIKDELIGMSRHVFEIKADAFKLKVTYIEEENDDYNSGQIFKLDPSSGYLSEGDKLTVYVSTGPSYFKMPSLLKLSEESAKATLKDYGLSVGKVTSDYSNTVEEGLVCSQSVAKGEQVKKGTKVDLVISLGRKTVTVPNVVGISKELAIQKLNDNELEVGNVKTQSSNTVAAGLVIYQSLEAYSSAKSGDKVDLIISTGKAAVSGVDSLIGKSETDAKSRLSSMGLRYVKSVYEYNSTVKEGYVIRVDLYDASNGGHHSTQNFYENDSVVLIVSRGPEPEPSTEEPTEPSDPTKPPETTEPITEPEEPTTPPESSSQTQPANPTEGDSPIGGREEGEPVIPAP